MGTAVGDLTAVTLNLGYLASGLLFAAVIAVAALGYWRLGWNPILCFWVAYVATRPLGASFADWMGKPQAAGGLGWGAGTVALLLTFAIVCLVAYLTITRRDVQVAGEAPRHGREPGLQRLEPRLNPSTSPTAPRSSGRRRSR
jgi:uncharacterized membrane-anchored protein